MGTSALNAQVPNPFYGVSAVAGGTLSSPTINAFRLLLLPQYTASTKFTATTIMPTTTPW